MVLPFRCVTYPLAPSEEGAVCVADWGRESLPPVLRTTSLMCGIALGIVCFGKIWLIDHLLFANPDITLMVDLVVCLALCVTVIIAKIVGGTLPLVAKALGADPAVMASPFITTIVDAVSLLVYFMFAKTMLGV